MGLGQAMKDGVGLIRVRRSTKTLCSLSIGALGLASGVSSASDSGISGTLWRAADEPAVVDCATAVTPLDSPPVRSPQAVHSFLTRIIRGKSLVEVGSRHGDGMACFAHVASSAVSIELSRQYCQRMEARAAQLAAGGRGNFSVVCRSAFSSGATPDADFYTWWQQGGLTDANMLSHLRTLVRSGAVRRSARALLLFSSWHRDRRSWKNLKPTAEWWREVAFDERPLCSRLLAHSRLSSETCDRANGTFIVASFALASG